MSSSASPATVLTRTQRRLLELTSRHGPRWVIATITAASVAVSDMVTAATMLLSPVDSEFVLFSMAVATAVPLVVAPLCSTAIVRLATALAAAVDELEVHATTDALTGIANRRQFFRLAERLLGSGRRDDSFLVAMIDIDHFKLVNDVHGHRAGDEALVALATGLSDAAEPLGGLVARLGGDEFVVMFPVSELSAPVATAAIEAATRTITTPSGIALAASVGWRVVERGIGVDEAIQSADVALYEAKADRRSGAAR